MLLSQTILLMIFAVILTAAITGAIMTYRALGKRQAVAIALGIVLIPSLGFIGALIMANPSIYVVHTLEDVDHYRSIGAHEFKHAQGTFSIDAGMPFGGEQILVINETDGELVVESIIYGDVSDANHVDSPVPAKGHLDLKDAGHAVEYLPSEEPPNEIQVDENESGKEHLWLRKRSASDE